MSDSFTTPWTEACQPPLSMGFPRQEYWNGLTSPFPGDLPNPGIKLTSPVLQADSLLSEPPGKPKLYSRLDRKMKRERIPRKQSREMEIGLSGGLTVRMILKEGGDVPCVMEWRVFQAEGIVSTEPWRWEPA